MTSGEAWPLAVRVRAAEELAEPLGEEGAGPGDALRAGGVLAFDVDDDRDFGVGVPSWNWMSRGSIVRTNSSKSPGWGSGSVQGSLAMVQSPVILRRSSRVAVQRVTISQLVVRSM
jgi:hypothetical protein